MTGLNAGRVAESYGSATLLRSIASYTVIDSWEIRVENVVFTFSVQVNGHGTRAWAELKQAPRQAV